ATAESCSPHMVPIPGRWWEIGNEPGWNTCRWLPRRRRQPRRQWKHGRNDRGCSSKDVGSEVEAVMSQQAAAVPLSWVGPMRLSGNVITGEQKVPLATYETPLWPSVGRGARISRLIEGGIATTLVSERMSRSVFFELDGAG